MTDKTTDLNAAVPDDDYEGLLPNEIEGLREFEAMEAEESAAASIKKVTDGDEEDGADAEAAAQASAKEPEPEPEPEPARLDLTRDLEGARSAMTQAKSSIKEIEDKWDNGEIAQDEYDRLKSEAETALDKAESDFDALNTLNMSQTLQERQRQATLQQQQDAAWEKANKAFVAANPEIVAPQHLEGFNRYVKAVTSDPDFVKLPFERQLDVAAQQYLAKLDAMGVEKTPSYTSLTGQKAPKAADAGAETPPDPKAQERAERGRQMQEPPVTLRDVPSDQVDAYDSTAQRWASMIERETDPDKVDEYWNQVAKDPALEQRVLQYGA